MISMVVDPVPPLAGTLVYRASDYSFATEPRPETCGSSFTINELELLVDDVASKRLVAVEGYCPHPGWQAAILRPPVSHPGTLRATLETSLVAGVAIRLQPSGDRWPILVDSIAGWIRLGNDNPTGDRVGIDFAPGAIAVLEADRIRAIWLHPQQLPSL